MLWVSFELDRPPLSNADVNATTRRTLAADRRIVGRFTDERVALWIDVRIESTGRVLAGDRRRAGADSDQLEKLTPRQTLCPGGRVGTVCICALVFGAQMPDSPECRK